MIDIIIGLLFLSYLFYVCLSKPDGYPPGPIRIPFVGYAPWVDKKLPYKTWDRLRTQYGDILGLYFGFSRTVVVSGWDAVKEGLLNDDLNDRPDNFINRESTKSKKITGVMFANHDFWKAQRRFALFHLRNLGFGKRSHEAVIHEELSDVIQEFTNAQLKPISVQVPLGVSATNILWAILGEDRFPRDDENLKSLVALISQAFKAGEATGGLLMAFPFLRHVFPNLGGYNTIVRATKDTLAFIQKYIDEHQATLDPKNPRDFIDVYLIELLKEQREESFTEEQLASLVFDIFLAGTETGSSLITFAIMFLCLHPLQQKMLQEEVDRVVGRDRLPSISDRNNLIKVDAFLQEVMRYRCPAPHTVAHWARMDTTLQGYRIPKDTVVMFNLRSIMMDEDYWGDPQVFRPERFIQDGVLRKYERMIPFGKGKRACLGEPLARMTSYLTFAALVQNLTFSFPSGQTVEDTEGFTGFTLAPPQFKVIATPRAVV